MINKELYIKRYCKTNLDFHRSVLELLTCIREEVDPEPGSKLDFLRNMVLIKGGIRLDVEHELLDNL